MTRRLCLFLGTIAALITIGGAFIAIMAGLPARYSIATIYCEEDSLLIVRLTTRSGDRLIEDCAAQGSAEWRQGLFSRSSTLSAAGELTDSSVRHLWILLKDCHGGRYIQHPTVSITDTHWSMSNVHVGREIASIEFWGVDDEGHRSLQDLTETMVEFGAWLPQSEEDLPARRLLGEISLIFKEGFPYIF